MSLISQNQLILLGPSWLVVNGVLGNDNNIDDPAEKLAWRFYATNTEAITAVDVLLSFLGDNSGITYQLGIYTDSSGSPGSLLTGASVTFTGPASAGTRWAGGGTNPLTLGASTGALTLNTPYWLVLEVASGTPNGTNYVRNSRYSVQPAGAKNNTYKLYSSGAWGSAQFTRLNIFILQHGSAGVAGIGVGTSIGSAANPATDIYGNYRQGLKCRFGSKVGIVGIFAAITTTGSPQNLLIKIYEGSTLKATEEIVPANVVSGLIMFSSTVVVSQDVDVYIVLLQKGSTADNDDGGNNSNDYDLSCASCPEAYWPTLYPANWAYVYGTGNDPTAFTSVKTTAPALQPVIMDLENDLDVPASGGAVDLPEPLRIGA